MKRNTWLVLVMVGVLALMGGMIGCGQPSDDSGGGTPLSVIPGTGETPPPNPNDTVAVKIELSFTDPNDIAIMRMIEEKELERRLAGRPEIEPNLITPGVPPGTILLFGTLIGMNDLGNRNCYSPWQDSDNNGAYECMVNYNSSVIGGALNDTFNSPVGTLVHVAYSLNGKMRSDSVTMSIGGVSTTFTTACILRDPVTGNTWSVISFMVQRSETGVETIVPNPNCTAAMYRVRLEVSGNSATNAYDDVADKLGNLLLPYNGVREGSMYFKSSLFNPGTSAQQVMASFDPAVSAWWEDLYMAATPAAAPIIMDAKISVYRDSREPTSPALTQEPALGGTRITVYNIATGGAALCAASELPHWEDTVLGAGVLYAGKADRLDPVTHCGIYGAFNWNTIPGGP